MKNAERYQWHLSRVCCHVISELEPSDWLILSDDMDVNFKLDLNYILRSVSDALLFRQIQATKIRISKNPNEIRVNTMR